MFRSVRTRINPRFVCVQPRRERKSKLGGFILLGAVVITGLAAAMVIRR
jgi:hypothetical protein